MHTARDVLTGAADSAVDVADARTWAAGLPARAVHCCVTSPPYWGQRDYDHPDQIGLEDDPDRYVSELVTVFRGVRRALHPRGVLWLNLGDKYRDKQLLGLPWRVAFALRDDGWWLRQWCPWVKRNTIPDSADDRPGTSCETVFLLTPGPDYFYDYVAVRRVAAPKSGPRLRTRKAAGPNVKVSGTRNDAKPDMAVGDGETRGFRSADLWFDSVGLLMSGDGVTPVGLDVTTDTNRRDAHFAPMPEELVLPLIRCGSSERGVCPECLAPWERVVEKERVATRPGKDTKVTGVGLTDGNRDPERHVTRTRTVGWRPTCDHPDAAPVPAVVMDPFAGSGTVLAVARQEGRVAVGCDLNEKYAAMARRRAAAQDPGLF